MKEIKLSTSRGSFSALSAGESNKETIIFLHGFPDCFRNFNLQLEHFSKLGYRVIAPALRGYERETQNKDHYYPLNDLADDMVSIIDSLGEDKVIFSGHDWGASIGLVTSILYPERIKGLNIIAVPHFRNLLNALVLNKNQLLKSWYMLFFQLPAIAEKILERNDWQMIEYFWKEWSPGWNYDDDLIENVKTTFSQPEVREAAIGYYRSVFNPRKRKSRESFRLLLKDTIEVPTLAICGKNDGCILSDFFIEIMNSKNFSRGLDINVLENAGHFAHLEKPDEVNQLIENWIKSL